MIYQGFRKEADLKLSRLLFSNKKEVAEPAAMAIVQLITPRFLPNSTLPLRGAVLLNSRPGNVFELSSIAEFVPNARIMFAMREPASRSISIVTFKHKANPTSSIPMLLRLMQVVWQSSLCVAPGVPPQEHLNIMLKAVMLRTPINASSLPTCLRDRIVF